jgi:uncharacterized membrane protein YdjX (TVP38/TMEM64 family)
MKKLLKILLAIFAIFMVIFLVREFQLLQYLNKESLETFLEPFGVFAPMVFMLIYYVITLLFVSATAFTIISGLLFGKLWGSVYVIIAASLSALTAFYISRYFGKDILEKLPEKGVGKLIRTLNAKIEHNCFKSFFVMRSLFLPYIPLSYAAGLVKKANAKDFFLATLITNIIFTPAFTYLGDSLLEGPKALILPVILIVLVLLVPKIVKRFK